MWKANLKLMWQLDNSLAKIAEILVLCLVDIHWNRQCLQLPQRRHLSISFPGTSNLSEILIQGAYRTLPIWPNSLTDFFHPFPTTAWNLGSFLAPSYHSETKSLSYNTTFVRTLFQPSFSADSSRRDCQKVFSISFPQHFWIIDGF